MEAFRIPNQLLTVTETYPEPKVMLEAVQHGGEPARLALTQLWLSEGIPYAFHKCPAVYEVARTWLSTHLGVHAKEIGLTGSARIGASLAPSKFGKTFNDSSDLDLYVVSNDLFESLTDEFNKWSYNFESGKIQPNNKREASFWSDNTARGPQLIKRGFIDQKMIPNLPDYPITQNISQRMWLLIEKLKLTRNAPKPKYASIRCYKSWESFVQQLSINLSSIKNVS